MFVLPALFTPEDSRPVVLFDGECNLCNWGVNYLMDHDRCSEDARGNLRVAALQSAVGQLMLRRLPPEKLARARSSENGQYKSIVVICSQAAYVGSDAVLFIAKTALRGPLRWLGVAGGALPRRLRDPAYSFVSSRRQRWFGKAPDCRVWDDNFDTRFLSDEVLVGGGTAPSADAANLVPGAEVRVVSAEPVVVKHLKRYPTGVCLQGLVGRVVETLQAKGGDRPYDIVVKFKHPSSFQAHLSSSELALVPMNA
ncbi:unnamed protein product [Prorocentrum cordatum]|uniref:DUF393 domain-containing protein n=1 Tax=Prorocentrum cordatum TaxID=2364126 RepID=A0ABN9TCS9_9DINO|nr:unnamed protein product [Polarella glacialis]